MYPFKSLLGDFGRFFCRKVNFWSLLPVTSVGIVQFTGWCYTLRERSVVIVQYLLLTGKFSVSALYTSAPRRLLYYSYTYTLHLIALGILYTASFQTAHSRRGIWPSWIPIPSTYHTMPNGFYATLTGCPSKRGRRISLLDLNRPDDAWPSVVSTLDVLCD